jgi:cytochrome c biogenesis protein CcmG/thiol:disulfide interchange protein DsbE
MHPALLLLASLVNDVRTLIAQHNAAAAEQTVRAAQMRGAGAPEVAASLSWLARAALDARQYDRADRFASETRNIADPLLATRPLDSDPWLPTAVGAAIEVHAQVLAAQGERAEAVAYLRQQLAGFGKTSIAERLRKNVNLLSLEGKPAPAIAFTDWLGPRPQPLSALHGHAVLLFFWAHWCVDCKGEVPILASLMHTYGPQGLVLEGPTRYYGYVAGGEDAAPAVEKPYIDRVRREFYGSLPGMAAPISASAFLAYGASTTPTLVLLDRAGIVRYYHPGAAPQAELEAQIRKALAR